MVKALHRAGIEVILDVVYNHTAEGNHLGPMLSFQGHRQPAYYRLMPDDPRYYMDFTGTGNSLNPVHPSVLRLIMDSLRYWVIECHVDGFRFDLASALAREFYDVDRLSAFFDVIHQDPVLSQVKLIAEPWDVGPGGYQVGNFPVAVVGVERQVPRRHARLLARAGERRASSRRASPARADLYQSDGRDPLASINFVTAHDGFTLADLVSYNEKHNEANGEDNRDGTDDNRSWNCGAEGPTDDREILALRARQQRNFLATLLLSQGVPMLLGGDEFGRTQDGNNNAWCQDNEISWLDWEHDAAQRELRELHAPADRAAPRAPGLPPHALPRRARPATRGLPDAWWFRPDGRQDDPARLGAATTPRSRRLPQRRRARRHRRRAASRSSTTRSCSSSTPTTRTSSSRCRRGASASSWQLMLATDDPLLEAGAAAAGGPRDARCQRSASLGRPRQPESGDVSACTAARDLPAAAEPGPRLRRRARARPLPRAISASATSTSRPSLQARRGLDARLRRRRPDAV